MIKAIQVVGSLWAKTSIALVVLSLAAFMTVNFVFDSTVFKRTLYSPRLATCC
jgi:hypothetical protein